MKKLNKKPFIKTIKRILKKNDKITPKIEKKILNILRKNKVTKVLFFSLNKKIMK